MTKMNKGSRDYMGSRKQLVFLYILAFLCDYNISKMYPSYVDIWISNNVLGPTA